MDGVGSPASTALSVAREIPARLAISTVLRPWDFLRRLSLSPNWRSKWSCITEELLETSICSVYKSGICRVDLACSSRVAIAKSSGELARSHETAVLHSR